MKDESKTKKQLISELHKLQKRISLLEKSKDKQGEKIEGLIDTETYFKAIMSSIQAGVMLIDTEKYKIVDINKTATELIGAKKSQIIGRVCHEYICSPQKGKCPFTDFNMVIDNSERCLINARGKKIPIIKTVVPITFNNRKYLLETFIDIRERKRMDMERENLIRKLQDALKKIKTLSGLLPICFSCKKIRDDKGYWNELEIYISEHSEADFSHGLCPECAKKLYPEYYKDK